jgi:hypothetical protein
VEGWIDEALEDLRDFRPQFIPEALKKYPDGVSTRDAFGEQDDGVKWSKREVAQAMVDSNAIVYRLELRQYQLMSTAHRTTLLKTFKPLAKE